MSQANWTILDNSLDGSSVRKGVTTGVARPNGGGNFVYGFNSLVTSAGAVGLFTNQDNFAPLAKGGSVRGAVKRGASGGPMNFAPMLFLGLGSPDVNASGYILGLDDDDPHRIVLRKGTLVTGIPAAANGTLGILAQGTETWLNDTWLHLRLDMIANTNGDVILKAFRSDLASHTVGAPAWVAVPGCETFVDDVLGVNSGSVPYTSGYAGFAFQTKDVSRRGFFDELEIQRQL